MLNHHILFVFLFEVVFDPFKMLFSLVADLRLILLLVEDQSIHRHHRNTIFQIYDVIPTFFECRFNFRCCEFAVRLVIHKPELPNEVIKLLFLFLKWSIVMELAVIVSKSVENGNIWKEFSEELLDLDVVFPEHLVNFLSFFSALILSRLRKFMGNQITCEYDVVNWLIFIDFVEQFEDVFHKLF